MIDEIIDGTEAFNRQILQRIQNSATPLSEQVTENVSRYFETVNLKLYDSNTKGIGRFGKRTYARPIFNEFAIHLYSITDFKQSMQKVFTMALQRQIPTTVVAGLIYELKILDYLIEEAKQIGIKTATSYAWQQIAKATRLKAGTLRRYWGRIKDTRTGKKKHSTTINREEALKVSQQIIRKNGLVKYTPKASE